MYDKMALFSDRSYTRVMVFIDYRNVFEPIHNTTFRDTRLDLYRLTQILVGSRELIGAYVFDSVERNAAPDDETVATHNKLRESGFRVVTYDLQHTDIGTVQKEVDVSLGVEMVEHALLNHYDVAIVISGDRDFFPAMRKVQAAGKRVEVAAFDSTRGEEWKRTADMYYLLDKIPMLSLSSPICDMGVGYRD